MLTASGYITTTEFTDNNPTVDVSQFTTATLSGIIATATAKVDSFLEYSLPMEIIANEKIEGLINSNGDLIVFPRKRPIDKVTAIDLVKGTSSITLSLTDSSSNTRYDVPEPKSNIVYPDVEFSYTGVSIVGSFDELRNTGFYIQLDYTAGYHSPPEWAKEATELYVLDILARRQNIAGASSIKQGAVSITYSERSGKSDFVQDAEEILASYKKIGGW